MDEEEVEKVLRLENYAMLLHLISKKNEDIMTIFSEYLKNNDSEYFLTSIEVKTEDAFQFHLEKYFPNNEDLAKLRTLRSQRDPNLRRVFKAFKKDPLSIDKILKKLRKIIDELPQTMTNKGGIHSSTEKVKMIRQVSRKEKLESVFQMVYYGEFLNKPNEGPMIKQMFESENPGLLNCLEDYNKHNNYL